MNEKPTRFKCFCLQGYILRGLKFMNVNKAFAEQHYSDLASKPFFPSELPGCVPQLSAWEGLPY